MLVLLLAIASIAIAQDRPDFSGRWILESASPGSNAPGTLTVQQTEARTNVRGEPMTPYFKTITIEREFPTGPTRETHDLGLSGGTASGVTEAGASQERRTSHHSVKWQERTLVFDQRSRVEGAAGVEEWSERREEWSLVESGRLRVTITTRSSKSDTQTTTATYRR